MDEKERKNKINRIIYWLKQIDEIRVVRDWIMGQECGRCNPVLRKRTTFSILWGWENKKEFKLSDNMTILVMDGFKKSIEHLEKLIEESDQELVSIARAVYGGEITKEGR